MQVSGSQEADPAWQQLPFRATNLGGALPSWFLSRYIFFKSVTTRVEFSICWYCSQYFFVQICFQTGQMHFQWTLMLLLLPSMFINQTCYHTGHIFTFEHEDLLAFAIYDIRGKKWRKSRFRGTLWQCVPSAPPCRTCPIKMTRLFDSQYFSELSTSVTRAQLLPSLITGFELDLRPR